MKILIGLFITLIIVNLSFAESGKKIFLEKGCGSCHKETISTIGPSIKDIAVAYNGNVQRMKLFLLGKSEPLLNSNSKHLMKKFLKYTKTLNDKDLNALAKYLTTIPKTIFKPYK